MNPDTSISRPPGFWRTVRLLLSASRRRSLGRMQRQQQLLQHRTGSTTDKLSALGVVMVWVVTASLNICAAYVVNSAIEEGQRAQVEQQGKVIVSTYFMEALDKVENAESEPEKKRAKERLEAGYSLEADTRALELGGSKEEQERLLRERPRSDFVTRSSIQRGVVALKTTDRIPSMLASVFLIAWFVMLVFQGEGLELDIQRRRHPIWEWLFSHPIRPGAVFFSEMLSPIAANPIYCTGPLFFLLLYGSAYGPALGVVAALLIGVPVSLSAACVGKALEIGVTLRFPPRSRGALIGLMSWLGYVLTVIIFVTAFTMTQIVSVAVNLLGSIMNAIPWPLFAWSIGLQSDGSLSFLSGMLGWWVVSLVLIVSSVGFAVWGAQRGLAGASAGPKLESSAKKTRRLPLFGRDPLYRKEILWFSRDRGAIVQTILIPVTIAAFELFNLRFIFQNLQISSRSLSGAAVIFGTYFLWVLGPRSLASEGPALWLAQTWPRGLEELMKAKARLWFLIATMIVSLFFAIAIIRWPGDAWKILLVAAGWLAFGRSMAEKSVTLVSVSSSSGEPEPIPKGRRFAAALGTLTFSVGILGGRWELAVVGIVYSWLTAAAMWENFRARLPFLFDPWSEKVPPPPTLMHAMIAISVLVEGAALLTGVLLAFSGSIGSDEARGVIQAFAFALMSIAVSLATSNWLATRGVPSQAVWCWQDLSRAKGWWWSGDGKWDRHLLNSLAIGAACGVVLALIAKAYLLLLSLFPQFSEMLRISQEQLENVPALKLVYAMLAVLCAPLAEEYLFRGLLFRALERHWAPWAAIFGSAAFFMIYHPPLAWPPVFLVGVATAIIYKKTGRLAPAVILHMSYNAMIVLG